MKSLHLHSENDNVYTFIKVCPFTKGASLTELPEFIMHIVKTSASHVESLRELSQEGQDPPSAPARTAEAEPGERAIDPPSALGRKEWISILKELSSQGMASLSRPSIRQQLHKTRYLSPVSSTDSRSSEELHLKLSEYHCDWGFPLKKWARGAALPHYSDPQRSKAA